MGKAALFFSYLPESSFPEITKEGIGTDHGMLILTRTNVIIGKGINVYRYVIGVDQSQYF